MRVAGRSSSSSERRFKTCAWLASTLFIHDVCASDTITVAAVRYGADHELGLVVVAMEADEVNATWPEPKVGLDVEQYYAFVEPLDAVEEGVAYAAVTVSEDTVAVYFSSLPLIRIDAQHEIPDEPRVPARFSLWSNTGMVNNAHIGIERSGGFSQLLPKPSYRIEFVTAAGGSQTVDRSLLDMRMDDDWNLKAMAMEPLRLRTVVGQRLWTDVHRPYYDGDEPDARSGVRMEYAELFLNDNYMGLYAVGERVDRKQLKLKKFTHTVRGELYKGEDWGATTFGSPPGPYNDSSLEWEGFTYIHPEEHVSWSRLSELAHFITTADDALFHQQIGVRFHRGNAIDYFLFLNLLRAGDNIGKNIYIARYDREEPYFYVPWDLDATFGLLWDGSQEEQMDGIMSNGLYDRWRGDLSEGGFMHALCLRWAALREGPFAVDSLVELFSGTYERLKATGVYGRETMAWSHFEHDDSHMDHLGAWIADRVAYLDHEFGAPCLSMGSEELAAAERLRLSPNPTSGVVRIGVPDVGLPARLTVTDATGRLIMDHTVRASTSIDVSPFGAGIYHIVVMPLNGAPLRGKLLVH